MRQSIESEYSADMTSIAVGFGDLYPTKAATKILLFPFGIVTVALLANLVSFTTSARALIDGQLRLP